MIEIQNASFRYANSDGGVLNDISLSINNGACVLLCGKSGCGKTTLTRLINGLIPHYYEGEMSGSVTVNGLDVTGAELYETARLVGSVFQNPRSQFFCVDTTSEIAFGCENIGLPVPVVESRIRESADELNMGELLGRNIFNLSGGEKQKVACASVSAVCPEIFVLDEPTSNLDIDAIEDLKKTLLLWKSQGKTIIIAEHRLYWLRELCDRVIYLDEGKIDFDISMSEFTALPDEKMKSLGLRAQSFDNMRIAAKIPVATGTMEFENYHFSYQQKDALAIDSLSLPAGGVIAVIGHNGAGKSTFSRCLCGLEKKFKGKVTFDGMQYNRKTMLKKCYMVMQDVNHQLFCESVEDEVCLGMDEDNEKDISAILSGLGLSALTERHPMSLSGGQKQRVAIASAILAGKEILVFDEPTSGLDFEHMEQTAVLLRSLYGRKTVFVITHDPELIVRCCTHILHLESGSAAENYPLNEDTYSKLLRFFQHPENKNVSLEPHFAEKE